MRHKVILIIAFLCSAILGLGAYLYLPKVYRATSLLSYQKQSVNPNEMSPDVDARIQDMVSTLSQIVTSRTNLEKLIKSQKLYPEELEKLPMEDIVDSMRGQIEIVPSQRGDTFSISFSGKDPRKVARVTNAIAAMFVEENLKYREERASETSAYTGDELAMAKGVLDDKEATMRDYKMKYYNEMPEQRETNVQQLISLQEQYQNRQLNIQELERTKILIQEQINVRQNALSSQQVAISGQNQGDRGGGLAVGTAAQNLQSSKAQLDRLLMKYTERHPDVKRLRKVIADLEDDLASQTTEQGSSGSGLDLASYDSTLVNLKIQLKEIKLSVRALNTEKITLKKDIETLEKWIAASPVREAEWSALTREYGETKRHYDYLVSQNLQAQSVLHLERRQKGSQFKIEDSARLPEKPFSPDFKKILVASLVAIVGLTAGLIFAKDFLDPSFRVGSDMEKSLGLPIICTLRYIETEKEKRWGRVFSVLTFLLLTVLSLGVCSVYAYFWFDGKIIL